MADAEDIPALFTARGDTRFTATPLSRGPWDAQALHGGPVAALIARALEAVLSDATSNGDPGFAPARFVLELERPIGLVPVTVTAELTRPGRSVRTADATVHDDEGRRLARATLVTIRTCDEPLDLTDAVRPDDIGPAPSGAPAPAAWDTDPGPAFHRDAVDHSFVRGSFGAVGPAMDWIRLRVPVLAGEEPTPLQRVVAVADFGNGISAAVPHDTHTFINPDLVVALHRTADGEAIGLEATTRVEETGIGLTETTLWDSRGRIGTASQTLVVDPR